MDLREMIAQLSSFPSEVLDQLSPQEMEDALELEQRLHNHPAIVLTTDDEKEFPLFCQPTMQLIRQVTGLGGDFRVIYHDQDGDEVQVETDVEFEEMMEVAKEMGPHGGAFELIVTQRDSDSSFGSDSETESDCESDSEEEEEEEEEEDEEEEEKGKEEEKNEFELPDFFKAKVLEVEGMLEDMGCTGVPRKRIIEVLFEHNWKTNQSLIMELLDERMKMMEERKVKAKEAVMAFLASGRGDLVFERAAELMGEDGDALAGFAKAMQEAEQ